MKIIIALLMCASLTLSQNVYEVPFASQGNTIELSVANSSALAVDSVKVEVTDAPVWLKFERREIVVEKLQPKEEHAVLFAFSVDKTALVSKEQSLSFTITEKAGQQWKKEIKIRITPPMTYELFQNYPNPFNPTTVISYQLSAVSRVSLKIYDILGREVAQLVNEEQEPGGHQALFDARHYASGMYIYRLIATENLQNPSALQKTDRHVFQKRMMLVR
jgi:hypothetical protein